ncbi:hypothetical protein BJV77DRAFT_791581 [Russula vinacea]|nr:hypothetical protein BJV77DRAFT_791581 [Russula vinacea]
MLRDSLNTLTRTYLPAIVKEGISKRTRRQGSMQLAVLARNHIIGRALRTASSYHVKNVLFDWSQKSFLLELESHPSRGLVHRARNSGLITALMSSLVFLSLCYRHSPVVQRLLHSCHLRVFGQCRLHPSSTPRTSRAKTLPPFLQPASDSAMPPSHYSIVRMLQ